MAALDAVGDNDADPSVMLESVPQDFVFNTLKVSCACVAELMFACVCVCAGAPSICLRETLYLHFLNLVCVCKFESGWEVGVIKAFERRALTHVCHTRHD